MSGIQILRKKIKVWKSKEGAARNYSFRTVG